MRASSIVYGGYGFIEPGSREGVSFTVAKAFGAKAVRAYRAIAMAFSRQNCESGSRR